MIFKVKPYSDQKGQLPYILGKIEKGTLRPTIPKEFNNLEIIELLNNCWNSYSKARPTMIEIIEELELIISNLLSTNPIISTITKKKKMNERNIEEVCEWLKTLKLSKDYSTIIREEGIQGKSLIKLNDNEWKEIFPKTGDRAIIRDIVKQNQ